MRSPLVDILPSRGGGGRAQPAGLLPVTQDSQAERVRSAAGSCEARMGPNFRCPQGRGSSHFCSLRPVLAESGLREAHGLSSFIFHLWEWFIITTSTHLTPRQDFSYTSHWQIFLYLRESAHTVWTYQWDGNSFSNERALKTCISMWAFSGRLNLGESLLPFKPCHRSKHASCLGRNHVQQDLTSEDLVLGPGKKR